MGLAEQQMAPVLEGHDEDMLARAKTLWLFGEWRQLVTLEVMSLSSHPNRDRVALLIASGHQQLGDHKKAREYVRMAFDWGCTPRVVAQILIAGVHNTLGRAAALKQDNSRITLHFNASIEAISTKDTALVSHARAVREMARLGLLSQAGCLVDQQLEVAHDPKQRMHQQEAHYKVLKTEIDLLSHELSLAQQRRQLFRESLGDDQAVLGADSKGHFSREELKNHSVSQLGQDLWVLEQTGYKRDGFFVEFGATDGVLLSNSWLLEKEFGWRGICAEPNPKFINELKRNRNCIVSSACIGAKTGERVEFVFAGAFGGMQQHLDDDMHGEKRSAYVDTGEVTMLETISLHDFLTQHGAPREIDYLSIDTEGSEFEILQYFPFDQWRIRLLTIEHNFTTRRVDIRDLLERNGYRCMEMQWDDWYCKEL